MIIEQFKYFARYPQKDGVLSMFTEGESSHSQYAELISYVQALPDPLVPGIESFVFGQEYDDVKRRVDSITGSFLFVDFGEFASDRLRNSISDEQKMACTVALKVPDSADMVEMAIVSDISLGLLTEVRRQLIADSHSEQYPWLETISDRHDIIPFISPEFKAVGWTLMFRITGSDLFNVKSSLPQ